MNTQITPEVPNFSQGQLNCAIAAIIAAKAKEFPELRFNQLLEDIGVTVKNKDLFYEDSTETFKRVLNTVFNANM